MNDPQQEFVETITQYFESTFLQNNVIDISLGKTMSISVW